MAADVLIVPSVISVSSCTTKSPNHVPDCIDMSYSDTCNLDATLPAAGCCGPPKCYSNDISCCTLPAAECCADLPYIDFDYDLRFTLSAAECCEKPISSDSSLHSSFNLPAVESFEHPIRIDPGVTLPAAECCENPQNTDSKFCGYVSPISVEAVPDSFHANGLSFDIDSHILPGFSLEGSKGNSYLPTFYIPGIHSLRVTDREFPPYRIGNLPSQMNLESWTHELSYEIDAPLRNYLFYGIKDGFTIVDPEADVPSYDSPNYISSTSGPAFEFMNNLLRTELHQGKYIRTDSIPHCIHALGAIPKPDGKYRPITDCRRPLGSSINNYMNLTCETFSYNSVDDVCSQLQQGCYMATIDISSAYRSISINPKQWTYQGIRWNFDGSETLMMDTRICFGGKNSPYLFTQISNFVTRCMIRRGFPNVINYLDDFMVFGNTWEECQIAQLTLIDLLISLGFEIAWKKTTSPSQRCVYLGIVFDSNAMEISLPPHKLEKLHHELDFFANRDRATKRQLQRLCGILAHCAKVVRASRTFSRRIIDLLCMLPEGNPRIHLSNEFKLDLQWWSDFAEIFNGTACVIENSFGLGPTIFSDSSLMGYGYVMGSYWQAGYFSSDTYPSGYNAMNPDHSHWLNYSCPSVNINVLELIPLLLATRRFGASWRNQRILCFSDNTQVVSCLNGGTSINSLSMEILREIFWSSAVNNFHITARPISGTDNHLPDLLSRIGAHNDITCVSSFPLCCSGSSNTGS